MIHFDVSDVLDGIAHECVRPVRWRVMANRVLGLWGLKVCRIDDLGAMEDSVRRLRHALPMLDSFGKETVP
mgnify:CR=1 FL=1